VVTWSAWWNAVLIASSMPLIAAQAPRHARQQGAEEVGYSERTESHQTIRRIGIQFCASATRRRIYEGKEVSTQIIVRTFS